MNDNKTVKKLSKFNFFNTSHTNHSDFKNLFDNYKNRVYNLAFSILKNKEDSEDILVEVFVSIHNNLENLDKIENINAYIYTITKNRSLNSLKQKQTYAKKFKNIENEDLLNYADNSIDIQMQFKEVNEIITSIVQKLPNQQKIIFDLIKLQGYKRKDVANILNISENTVRNHLNTAMKIVREEFNNKYSVLLPLLFWIIQK